MKRKHKRLVFVSIALVLLAGAAGLMLMAYEENIVFFRSPTDIVEKAPVEGRRLRLGGLVEEGSLKKDGTTVTFKVTDLSNTVPVTYTGILPDLFREGQGVVTEGRFQGGVFVASEVLAKHDENYMPPEVAEALKKSGKWKGGNGANSK
ncbi:MAG TPA: cytochrome c maturation protein CcmE [Rhodospirillales bacterium]|nr:cytochrome c maturation protein CcmE [Rhodospirillales bacterium]